MRSHTILKGVSEDAVMVFRVHTVSNVYLLGAHEAGGRRVAVLQGEPGSPRAHLVASDANPRIGDRPLWDVHPSAWVGHALTVATTTTSDVQKVERVLDKGTIVAVTMLIPIVQREVGEQSPTHAVPPRNAVRPTVPMASLARAPSPSAAPPPIAPPSSPAAWRTSMPHATAADRRPTAPPSIGSPYRAPDAGTRTRDRVNETIRAIEVAAAFLAELPADAELIRQLSEDAEARKRYANAVRVLASATDRIRAR